MLSLYLTRSAYLSMELSLQNGYASNLVWNHYSSTWLMLLSPLEKSWNLLWSGKWSPCSLTLLVGKQEGHTARIKLCTS